MGACRRECGAGGVFGRGGRTRACESSQGQVCVQDRVLQACNTQHTAHVHTHCECGALALRCGIMSAGTTRGSTKTPNHLERSWSPMLVAALFSALHFWTSRRGSRGSTRSAQLRH